MSANTKKKYRAIWEFVQEQQREQKKKYDFGDGGTDSLLEEDLLPRIRGHFERDYGADYPSVRTLRTILREGRAGRLKR